MQNSVVIFAFSVFDRKLPLLGKSKLSVWAEIWYLEEFEYAEFSDDVHFFCFWPYTSWANLVKKLKIVQNEIWYKD